MIFLFSCCLSRKIAVQQAGIPNRGHPFKSLTPFESSDFFLTLLNPCFRNLPPERFGSISGFFKKQLRSLETGATFGRTYIDPRKCNETHIALKTSKIDDVPRLWSGKERS